MTSHAVSRGRMAPLVGRRFVVVWLRVYFAGIQSLFAFISLTHKIMILFCIGAGTIGHCVDGSFYFVTVKKRENEEKSGGAVAESVRALAWNGDRTFPAGFEPHFGKNFSLRNFGNSVYPSLPVSFG